MQKPNLNKLNGECITQNTPYCYHNINPSLTSKCANDNFHGICWQPINLYQACQIWPYSFKTVQSYEGENSFSWSDRLLFRDPQQLRGDDWLGIFCADRFSTAATIDTISSLIYEENRSHPTQIFPFSSSDFCKLFSKMFYIQENVAGCKFWWVRQQ